jgi:hypothetical protein
MELEGQAKRSDFAGKINLFYNTIHPNITPDNSDYFLLTRLLSTIKSAGDDIEKNQTYPDINKLLELKQSVKLINTVLSYNKSVKGALAAALPILMPAAEDTIDKAIVASYLTLSEPEQGKILADREKYNAVQSAIRNTMVVNVVNNESSSNPVTFTGKKIPRSQSTEEISDLPTPLTTPVTFTGKKIPRSQSTEEISDLATKIVKEPVTYQTEVNFAGPKFIPGESQLDHTKHKELVQNEVLKTEFRNITGYDREGIKKFTFKENGFVYTSFEGGLYKLLKNYDINNKATQAMIDAEIKNMAAEWGMKEGIDFDVVVPLAPVYRKQYAAKGQPSPVPLTHVDFKKGERDFLRAHQSVWKPLIENALQQKLSDEEYEGLVIAELVNFWMPVKNEKPTENTLAVVDTKTLKKVDLLPFPTQIGENPMKFTAMTCHSKPGLELIFLDSMKVGDAVLFKTLRTPHTAVNVFRPEVTEDIERESVEYRVLFMKFPSKTDKKKQLNSDFGKDIDFGSIRLQI